MKNADNRKCMVSKIYVFSGEAEKEAPPRFPHTSDEPPERIQRVPPQQPPENYPLQPSTYRILQVNI